MLKSIIKRILKAKTQPDPTPQSSGAKFMLTRGSYELKSGAVALLRIESAQTIKEIAYYPEHGSKFFNDLTSSLNNELSVIVQTNRDPITLGLRKAPDGTGIISKVAVLGEG